MLEYQLVDDKSSYKEALKLLEADIHHANMLAASIPVAKWGDRFQMKLVYEDWAPILLFLFQWMDWSCPCLHPSYLNLFHIVIHKVKRNGSPSDPSQGRKASLREFYAVILPSLERLYCDSMELDDDGQEENQSMDSCGRKCIQDRRNHMRVDLEREDECGICLEHCTKMVLPNCCHAMCINCYRDWNMRSESCPFCRGSIKRVKSGDLWVLMSTSDAVDMKTITKEELLRFYIYMNSLPIDNPDALFLVYYEYLI